MNPPNNDLRAFIDQLSTDPGVYKMLDAVGEVLYVGKALHLKNRVSQYFNASAKGVKTHALVQQINSIEVIVTRSETEALLLESTLIKSLRPKYNVLLRDDKSYPYLQFSDHKNYPRLALVRHKKKPTEGVVFGPYPSATSARAAFNLLQKTFKLRDCSDAMFASRTRPCLQYQMQRCTAPCVGYIDAVNYQSAVADATKFLQGKSQLILESLEQRMQEAVAALAFENAAKIRDQIKQLRLAQEQQSMVALRGDLDVVVFDVRFMHAGIQWVSIRDGSVLQAKRFFPEIATNLEQEALWQAIFSAFIGQYYVISPERIPACIVTDVKPQECSLFEKLLSELRGGDCKIQTPSGLQQQWVEFAWQNLHLAVAEHESHLKQMAERYQELAIVLGVSQPIKRMECYDISHTQGHEPVASCVVFDAYGPKRSQYRLYNIRDINNGDDVASMRQVLMRRFHKITTENHPDIVIIDGGLNQVNAAREVLSELNIADICLFGVAKGVTRKAGLEYLVFADKRTDITLPSDSKALHLLQHIRDESHRFAITAHRKRRQKQSLRTDLADIPGIGPKRRLALWARFGGPKEVARASVAELAKVPGISKDLAQLIYNHLRN